MEKNWQSQLTFVDLGHIRKLDNVIVLDTVKIVMQESETHFVALKSMFY